MRINKKVILIIVILLLVGLVAFFFVFRKKEGKPTVSPLPTPKLSSNFKGEFPVNLVLKEEAFKLPIKLNLLEASPATLADGYFKNIAQKLGFQGEPMEISDVFDGKTYFWKNDNYSFFVFSQKGKVRYNQNTSSTPINKQLSDQSLENTATSFLADNGIIESDSFSLSKIKYLEKNEKDEGFKETEREKATMFEVSFNYKVAGYEILTPQYTEPIVYVRMSLDGSIQSFQFINIAGLKTTPKEYDLKNYQETKDNLENAVLIGLRGAQVALGDLSTTAIKSVDINKIDLGYLYDPGKSTILQPIYILTGTAKVEGYDNEEIFASLYLSALSINQP
jgi:hypothetical protein